MRLLDISQLASSSATGLLAVQVRSSLRSYQEHQNLTDLQRTSVREAWEFLTDALEGMEELQRFSRDLSFAGDKLDEVRAFRIAASALTGELRSTKPEDLNQFRRQIERAKTDLDEVLCGLLPGKESRDADFFFSELARHEAARGRQIVGESSRSLPR